MKYLKPALACALVLSFVLSSCTKEDYSPKNIEVEDVFNNFQDEGQIVLGQKLEDPYSLKNIEQAYSNLKSSNSGAPDIDLTPTHKYLRFLPNDDKEWNVLKSDENLVLYDFPMDYEIINRGTFYHDPSVPKDAITWQYCVVPIEYTIPNVHYELMYEVFIPEINDNKNSSALNQFLLDLEHESVKLTGNLPKDEGSLKGTKGLLPSKWTPKGKIKVWDDLIGSTTTYTKVFDHWEYYDCDGNGELPLEKAAINLKVIPIDQCKRAVYRYIPHTTEGSYIPLIQASVHARWFTHVETDLTDNNGYFQTSQFRYEVNYAIKWERGHYDIRDGMFGQAWYNGPKKKGDWNLNIRGGKSIMYASIHRAAYKQFYGNNLGINRPISSSKTKLCYIDEPGTGVFWGDWGGGILPDIKIWGKSTHTGAYKTTDNVFATTTHELGHLSHWEYIGVINYAQTSKNVYESWAEGIEWALTNDEYHTMGARFGGTNAINYNCPYTNQLRWPFVGDRAYSPIFIDLIDDDNQRDALGTNYPNDLITGYSILYIQNNILGDSYGFSSLRDAVKNNKIAGVTDADVDELFALYWN